LRENLLLSGVPWCGQDVWNLWSINVEFFLGTSKSLKQIEGSARSNGLVTLGGEDQDWWRDLVKNCFNLVTQAIDLVDPFQRAFLIVLRLFLFG